MEFPSRKWNVITWIQKWKAIDKGQNSRERNALGRKRKVPHRYLKNSV
jgi:hypothetical protein